MLIIFLRALILYVVVVVVFRMMGKRQVAQMQPFELVIALLIAELAATPMENTAIPLIYGIIPILTLLAAQVIVSFLSIKSEGFRELICGKPSLIISKGQIVQKEIKRLRINMNDLLEQLRGKDYPNLSDVEYAILETNGQLSIIPKVKKRNVIVEDLDLNPDHEELPITLIVDGKIMRHNLNKSGHNEDWLRHMLKKENIDRVDEVFFAFLSSNREFFAQRKQI
ncbi:YetF domain-containing protein [Alkaliphilus crotonatoxidans]